MADQPEEGKKEGKKEEKKDGKKNILLIGVIILFIFLILLLIGGAVAFFYLGFPGGAAGSSDDVVQDPEHQFTVENFIVNLADSEQRRFLKASMVFTYHEEDLQEELEGRKAQLRDMIIDILRNKKVAEIEEAGSTERIRSKIVSEVNEMLSEGEIEEVYFTEFIVQ